jgi:hypothetical protein
MDLVKTELKKLLGRDVGVEKLKSGRFICKYFSYSMSPLQLVGDTEDDAYRNLLRHLHETKPTDNIPTGA